MEKNGVEKMYNVTVIYTDDSKENFLGSARSYVQDGVLYIAYSNRKSYGLPICNIKRFLMEEVRNEDKKLR